MHPPLVPTPHVPNTEVAGLSEFQRPKCTSYCFSGPRRSPRTPRNLSQTSSDFFSNFYRTNRLSEISGIFSGISTDLIVSQNCLEFRSGIATEPVVWGGSGGGLQDPPPSPKQLKSKKGNRGKQLSSPSELLKEFPMLETPDSRC